MNIVSINGYSSNNNFKGWNEKELNILGRNKSEMRELGLDFQKAPYEDIFEASRIHNIFGIEKKSKTLEAFIKLLTAVEAVKEEKRNYESDIKTLELVAKIKRKMTKTAARKIATLNKKLKNMERNKSYLHYYEVEDTHDYSSDEPEQSFREQTDWLVRL